LRLPRALGLALAALIALPALSAAQSLGELAARERAKKKGQKPAGKVITDDDLRRVGSGRGTLNTGLPEPAASPSAGQATAAGAAAPDGEKPKTEDELRAEREQAWRDKVVKAQDDVRRLTQAVDAVQRQLDDLSGNLYSGQRTTLLANHDKWKAELLTAQQQVTALDEEGRRSRFRP
jgi:hypothetical protein